MKSRKNVQNRLVKMFETHAALLATEFAYKYFGKDHDFYWVGNEAAGVAEINDRYFSMMHMYEALKFNITRAQLFAWYDDSITPQDDHMRISLRNWRFIDVGGKDTIKR
jgi:hypothetical protein